MDEESARTLARRVVDTQGYRVLEDRRTGERLLLLNEDRFDARLMSAGEPTTVTTAARSCKEPAAAQVAPGPWPGHEPFHSEDSPS